MVVFVIAAVFAPLLAPYGFSQTSDAGQAFARQAAPSAEHWFGTSVRGEDVFSRVIYGARTALMVIASSLLLSLIMIVSLSMLMAFVHVLVLTVFMLFLLFLEVPVLFRVEGSILVKAPVLVTTMEVPVPTIVAVPFGMAVLIFDIPQAGLVVGQHIRARVDIAFLGSHHGPSTFRFDAPHRSHRVRHPMPHPITVRYLIKPVSRGDRADLYRLK